jgi:hypothetical protein
MSLATCAEVGARFAAATSASAAATAPSAIACKSCIPNCPGATVAKATRANTARAIKDNMTTGKRNDANKRPRLQTEPG